MAKNILVVANETLGGRPLTEAVTQRAAQGDANFIVIAPQNQPKSGYVVYDNTAIAAAQHRLETTIQHLRDAGVEATSGTVTDPDAFSAVKDAVDEYQIDEIIISTHPETRSGWFRRGLVDRIESEFDKPVLHVVVDFDAERGSTAHTLVVANQTVLEQKLLDLLKKKATEKSELFIVIVPPVSGEPDEMKQAQERLEMALTRMKDQGLEATGSLGDPDPFTAIMNALQLYSVDDIVISTYAETKSGWMRSHLIDRVRRATSTPIEHLIPTNEAAVS